MKVGAGHETITALVYCMHSPGLKVIGCQDISQWDQLVPVHFYQLLGNILGKKYALDYSALDYPACEINDIHFIWVCSASSFMSSIWAAIQFFVCCTVVDVD